jgi:biotin carboxyl carrier protein
MKLAAMVGDRLHEIVIERREAHFLITVDGQPIEADARRLQGDYYSILLKNRSYAVSVEADGDSYCVRHGAAKQIVTLTDPSRRAREGGLAAGRGPTGVTSMMPGKVVRVLVREGDEVQAGQGLVVVEAMKMENEIASPKSGRVVSVQVEPGRPVEAGATLVVVD